MRRRNQDQEPTVVFISYMLYFNSFYFWDLLPILMNLVMHHRNFRQRTIKSESVDNFDVFTQETSVYHDTED